MVAAKSIVGRRKVLKLRTAVFNECIAKLALDLTMSTEVHHRDCLCFIFMQLVSKPYRVFPVQIAAPFLY